MLHPFPIDRATVWPCTPRRGHATFADAVRCIADIAERRQRSARRNRPEEACVQWVDVPTAVFAQKVSCRDWGSAHGIHDAQISREETMLGHRLAFASEHTVVSATAHRWRVVHVKGRRGDVVGACKQNTRPPLRFAAHALCVKEIGRNPPVQSERVRSTECVPVLVGLQNPLERLSDDSYTLIRIGHWGKAHPRQHFPRRFLPVVQ